MTRAIIPPLLLALAALGCTRWVPVRPDQLAKLERGRTERVGDVPRVVYHDRYGRHAMVGSTPLIETSRQTVLRPDGTTTEIVGRFDLRLTSADETVEFEHPVLVERDGDALLIAGAETPERRYALDAITAAELSQGGGGTVWVGLALAAVAVGLMLAYVE